MTIRASSQTLNVAVAPSHWLVTLFVTAHLLACLVLLFLNIQFWWLCAAWFLVTLHGVYAWRDIAWARTLQHLRCHNGEFYLSLSTDKQHHVLMDGSHFVAPWLTILSVRINGKRRFIPLLGDACDADSLRRLRVLLRCRTRNANR